MTDPADFTRRAAELVAENDRRVRRREFAVHLLQAAQRVGIAWSALTIAAFALVLLPMNMRAA